MKTKKLRLFAVFLSALLLLPLSGCGNQVTLSQIASKIGPISALIQPEMDALKEAGVIGQAEYDNINALGIPAKSKQIGIFLTGLQTINAENKAEVLAKIQEAIDLFRNVSGLPDGSKLARILAAGVLILEPLKLAVELQNPPAASFALGASSDIAVDSIKVELSKDVRAALKAAGIK